MATDRDMRKSEKRGLIQRDRKRKKWNERERERVR
jgi:hypothetical protein